MVSRTRRSLAIGIAGALAASLLGGIALSSSAGAATADGTVNGYRNIGYFAQWGVYARGYKVKAIQDSGVAGQLTAVNYAFANINNQTLSCFEANKAQGTGPTGSDGAGDAYADYGMSYAAADAVSGVADTWDQPLAGSFNQLKQLKAKNPGLKVILSIGGWTWSKNFSAAAATDASRKKLVSSCIDLFIKGNLPVIDGRGGPGSAAGVFDGFDLDWEWPGSPNGNDGNIVDTANDAANLKLLAKEFRTQLDAYTATSGQRYTLSAFLPANPADITAGGWNDPALYHSLDYGNVQGYDLWGAWNPTLTGHQSNLYDDPADTRPAAQRFSVDKAIRTYTANGVDPKQLGLGMPLYGRGWQGNTAAAPWTAATAAAPGTYEAGIEDYDKIASVGTQTTLGGIGASYSANGNLFWSYDNPAVVQQKSAYIAAKGLGGAMWWDLSGNRDGTLVKTAATAFRGGARGPVAGDSIPMPTPTPTPTGTPTATPTPTPTPTPTTPPAGGTWSATAIYQAGDTVTYNGITWKAKWWTQGDTPGGSSGAWQALTSPGTGPQPWSATAIYVGGDQATYGGHTYQAKWWTQGTAPSTDPAGPWQLVS